MASLNSRIHSAPSHTLTHFLDSSVSDSVHADHMYGVDDAFFRMDLAHPGPGASPDPQGDCSSYDLRLHLEQALLNDWYVALYSEDTCFAQLHPSADVQLMSSLMLDDAAAYAYGSPSSLLSTPQPEPLSQYAYDQLYPSTLSPPLQSDFDTRQHSSVSVGPWTARSEAIPVQSAYSTVVDAFGYCRPADVYAPTSPPASTMAPSSPATATAVFGERQAESAPESRKRENSTIYQQPTYSSSYPSPTPSSSASSSFPSPSPSSPASSSYFFPSPSSSASSSYPSPTFPSSSSSSRSRDSSKPEVIFTPRRNIAVSPNARPAVSKNPLKCSFCRYVAPKGRLPDLRRHVKTHGKKNEDFKCCGVPLAEAKERGVPTERMKERPLVYQEIAMVGGCRKAFSRRDALLRHLRDNKGVCFGDAHAPYLLGNQ